MKADVNGTTIHYTLEGPGHAPIVMMSHSLLCSGAMWDAQMSALADYQVLRVDMRGHGASSTPGDDYTLEQIADDYIALMDHLEIEKVHFIGLSIGGMIGQTFALKAPERLLSITLSSTMSGIPAAAASMWDERIALAKAEGMEAHVESTIGRWFSDSFCAEHPELVDPIRELIRTTSVDGFSGCCRAISRLNLTDKLSAIKLPTLIIAGENDPGATPAVAEVIHQNIAGSELVVIDDTLHLCNIEKPDVFNRAITDFLAKH
jgi:3-oxoadipate enol-lactonase